MKFEDKLKNITNFTKRFHKRLGNKVVKLHVKQTRTRGLNVDGSAMEPYTGFYAYDKASMNYSENQNPKYAQRRPNLSLTGKMLDAMKLIEVSKKGFRYGINDPTQGHKATYHSGLRSSGLKEKYYRKITGGPSESDVVHPPVKDEIVGSYISAIIRNIKKLPKRKIMKEIQI